jgi:hypothetical protein
MLGYFGLDPTKRASGLVGNKLISVQTRKAQPALAFMEINRWWISQISDPPKVGPFSLRGFLAH